MKKRYVIVSRPLGYDVLAVREDQVEAEVVAAVRDRDGALRVAEAMKKLAEADQSA